MPLPERRVDEAPDENSAADLPAPSADERPTAIRADERRREPRMPCNVRITGSVVQPFKAHPVATGTPFAMRMLDFSRGGAQLQTPWPLAINEVLSLNLPLNDQTRSRLARVVRVRQNERDEWVAGVCFVGPDE